MALNLQDPPKYLSILGDVDLMDAWSMSALSEALWRAHAKGYNYVLCDPESNAVRIVKYIRNQGHLIWLAYVTNEPFYETVFDWTDGDIIIDLSVQGGGPESVQNAQIYMIEHADSIISIGCQPYENTGTPTLWISPTKKENWWIIDGKIRPVSNARFHEREDCECRNILLACSRENRPVVPDVRGIWRDESICRPIETEASGGRDRPIDHEEGDKVRAVATWPDQQDRRDLPVQIRDQALQAKDSRSSEFALSVYGHVGNNESSPGRKGGPDIWNSGLSPGDVYQRTTIHGFVYEFRVPIPEKDREKGEDRQHQVSNRLEKQVKRNGKKEAERLKRLEKAMEAMEKWNANSTRSTTA